MRGYWMTAPTATAAQGAATGTCPVNFTRSTVDQRPVVHFRGRGVHADFAHVEVDLIPARGREFTEAQVGGSRQEQKRPAAVPPAGRPMSSLVVAPVIAVSVPPV